MEPWCMEPRCEELLRYELLELHRVLQQLHRVQQPLRQELLKLRTEQVGMEQVRETSPFRLVLRREQENVDWRELDPLMGLRVTRD